MRLLRVLLIDDERLARQELRSMLATHPEIEVVGEAATVDLAVAQVRALAPDAVFLDIHLPPDSGFALLERVDRSCRVVFVTAHDAYAIRAFEVNALDYLLKPVHPDRLADAVRRLTLGVPAPATTDAGRPLEYGDRVFVESGGRARFVALEHVAAIHAADDYSEIVTVDGGVLLVTRSLRDWEARLPARHFARIHRSTIVNLEHVERIERTFGRGLLAYVRGLPTPTPVSRRHAVRLRERFSA
jgi:two-component system LytT family response regulator